MYASGCFSVQASDVSYPETLSRSAPLDNSPLCYSPIPQRSSSQPQAFETEEVNKNKKFLKQIILKSGEVLDIIDVIEALQISLISTRYVKASTPFFSLNSPNSTNITTTSCDEKFTNFERESFSLKTKQFNSNNSSGGDNDNDAAFVGGSESVDAAINCTKSCYIDGCDASELVELAKDKLAFKGNVEKPHSLSNGLLYKKQNGIKTSCSQDVEKPFFSAPAKLTSFTGFSMGAATPSDETRASNSVPHFLTSSGAISQRSLWAAGRKIHCLRKGRLLGTGADGCVFRAFCKDYCGSLALKELFFPETLPAPRQQINCDGLLLKKDSFIDPATQPPHPPVPPPTHFPPPNSTCSMPYSPPHSSTLEDPRVLALQRNYALLSSLPPHPHIVRHFGTQRLPMNLLLFMEFLSGASVSAVLKRLGRPMCEPLISYYCRQLCRALAFLNYFGIINLDVKGANCMLLLDGLKMIDFGCCEIDAKRFAAARLEWDTRIEKRMEKITEILKKLVTIATSDNTIKNTENKTKSKCQLDFLDQFQESIPFMLDGAELAELADPEGMYYYCYESPLGPFQASQSGCKPGRIRGTSLWMAPESIMQGEGPFPVTYSSDMWSVACTVIELATARSPWLGCLFPNNWAAMFYIAQCGHGPPLPCRTGKEDNVYEGMWVNVRGARGGRKRVKKKVESENNNSQGNKKHCYRNSTTEEAEDKKQKSRNNESYVDFDKESNNESEVYDQRDLSRKNVDLITPCSPHESESKDYTSPGVIYLSNVCVDFLQRCFVVSSKERLSSVEALHHPFLYSPYPKITEIIAFNNNDDNNSNAKKEKEYERLSTQPIIDNLPSDASCSSSATSVTSSLGVSSSEEEESLKEQKQNQKRRKTKKTKQIVKNGQFFKDNSENMSFSHESISSKGCDFESIIDVKVSPKINKKLQSNGVGCGLPLGGDPRHRVAERCYEGHYTSAVVKDSITNVVLSDVDESGDVCHERLRESDQEQVCCKNLEHELIGDFSESCNQICTNNHKEEEDETSENDVEFSTDSLSYGEDFSVPYRNINERSISTITPEESEMIPFPEQDCVGLPTLPFTGMKELQHLLGAICERDLAEAQQEAYYTAAINEVGEGREGVRSGSEGAISNLASMGSGIVITSLPFLDFSLNSFAELAPTMNMTRNIKCCRPQFSSSLFLSSIASTALRASQLTVIRKKNNLILKKGVMDPYTNASIALECRPATSSGGAEERVTRAGHISFSRLVDKLPSEVFSGVTDNCFSPDSEAAAAAAAALRFENVVETANLVADAKRPSAICLVQNGLPGTPNGETLLRSSCLSEAQRRDTTRGINGEVDAKKTSFVVPAGTAVNCHGDINYSVPGAIEAAESSSSCFASAHQEFINTMTALRPFSCDTLGDGIIHFISSFLDHQSLCRLAATSRYLYSLCDGSLLSILTTKNHGHVGIIERSSREASLRRARGLLRVDDASRRAAREALWEHIYRIDFLPIDGEVCPSFLFQQKMQACGIIGQSPFDSSHAGDFSYFSLVANCCGGKSLAAPRKSSCGAQTATGNFWKSLYRISMTETARIGFFVLTGVTNSSVINSGVSTQSTVASPSASANLRQQTLFKDPRRLEVVSPPLPSTYCCYKNSISTALSTCEHPTEPPIYTLLKNCFPRLTSAATPKVISRVNQTVAQNISVFPISREITNRSYVIYSEILNPDGRCETFMESCTKSGLGAQARASPSSAARGSCNSFANTPIVDVAALTTAPVESEGEDAVAAADVNTHVQNIHDSNKCLVGNLTSEPKVIVRPSSLGVDIYEVLFIFLPSQNQDEKNLVVSPAAQSNEEKQIARTPQAAEQKHSYIAKLNVRVAYRERKTAKMDAFTPSNGMANKDQAFLNGGKITPQKRSNNTSITNNNNSNSINCCYNNCDSTANGFVINKEQMARNLSFHHAGADRGSGGNAIFAADALSTNMSTNNNCSLDLYSGCNDLPGSGGTDFFYVKGIATPSVPSSPMKTVQRPGPGKKVNSLFEFSRTPQHGEQEPIVNASNVAIPSGNISTKATSITGNEQNTSISNSLSSINNNSNDINDKHVNKNVARACKPGSKNSSSRSPTYDSSIQPFCLSKPPRIPLISSSENSLENSSFLKPKCTNFNYPKTNPTALSTSSSEVLSHSEQEGNGHGPVVKEAVEGTLPCCGSPPTPLNNKNKKGKTPRGSFAVPSAASRLPPRSTGLALDKRTLGAASHLAALLVTNDPAVNGDSGALLSTLKPQDQGEQGLLRDKTSCAESDGSGQGPAEIRERHCNLPLSRCCAITSLGEGALGENKSPSVQCHAKSQFKFINTVAKPILVEKQFSPILSYHQPPPQIKSPFRSSLPPTAPPPAEEGVLRSVKGGGALQGGGAGSISGADNAQHHPLRLVEAVSSAGLDCDSSFTTSPSTSTPVGVLDTTELCNAAARDVAKSEILLNSCLQQPSDALATTAAGSPATEPGEEAERKAPVGRGGVATASSKGAAQSSTSVSRTAWRDEVAQEYKILKRLQETGCTCVPAVVNYIEIATKAVSESGCGGGRIVCTPSNGARSFFQGTPEVGSVTQHGRGGGSEIAEQCRGGEVGAGTQCGVKAPGGGGGGPLWQTQVRYKEAIKEVATALFFEPLFINLPGTVSSRPLTTTTTTTPKTTMQNCTFGRNTPSLTTLATSSPKQSGSPSTSGGGALTSLSHASSATMVLLLTTSVGVSLGQLFTLCGQHFSLKTSLKLLIKIIRNLCLCHERDVVFASFDLRNVAVEGLPSRLSSSSGSSTKEMDISHFSPFGVATATRSSPASRAAAVSSELLGGGGLDFRPGSIGKDMSFGSDGDTLTFLERFAVSVLAPATPKSCNNALNNTSTSAAPPRSSRREAADSLGVSPPSTPGDFQTRLGTGRAGGSNLLSKKRPLPPPPLQSPVAACDVFLVRLCCADVFQFSRTPAKSMSSSSAFTPSRCSPRGLLGLTDASPTARTPRALNGAANWFMSPFVQQGCRASPRDNIISAIYLAVFTFTGGLPWVVTTSGEWHNMLKSRELALSHLKRNHRLYAKSRGLAPFRRQLISPRQAGINCGPNSSDEDGVGEVGGGSSTTTAAAAAVAAAAAATGVALDTAFYPIVPILSLKPASTSTASCPQQMQQHKQKKGIKSHVSANPRRLTRGEIIALKMDFPEYLSHKKKHSLSAGGVPVVDGDEREGLVPSVLIAMLRSCYSLRQSERPPYTEYVADLFVALAELYETKKTKSDICKENVCVEGEEMIREALHREQTDVKATQKRLFANEVVAEVISDFNKYDWDNNFHSKIVF